MATTLRFMENMCVSKAKGGDSSILFTFSFKNQKFLHPFVILGICNSINMSLIQIEFHLGIVPRERLKAIEYSPHGH
jgi:hypothetical protein